jgi:hypothetical protein
MDLPLIPDRLEPMGPAGKTRRDDANSNQHKRRSENSRVSIARNKDESDFSGKDEDHPHIVDELA